LALRSSREKRISNCNNIQEDRSMKGKMTYGKTNGGAPPAVYPTGGSKKAVKGTYCTMPTGAKSSSAKGKK